LFAYKPLLAISGLVLMAMVSMPLSPVLAQSNSDVAERFRQIEQVLNDLQRVIYKGEAPPPRPTLTPQQSGAQSPADTARFVDMEVRLSGLEEQLRSITGPIETMEHRVDVIGNRLNKLVADIDFRLSAIERKLSGEQMAAPATTDASAAQTQPATTVVTTVVEQAATGTQVLGTVPVTDTNAAGQQTAAVTQAAPIKAKGVLPDGTVQARYDYAYGLLRRLKMADAEVALKEFLEAHAQEPLADNARYWLGESYFSRRDYTRAAATFFEAYSKAPLGIKARDNLYKLGKSLARMEQKDDACASFDELLAKFNKPIDQPMRQRAQVDRTELGCQ
jgi:tol-pal system protein YbgF